MKNRIIIDFENDKKLIFEDGKLGLDVTFGDCDEEFKNIMSHSEIVELIQFLVKTL